MAERKKTSVKRSEIPTPVYNYVRRLESKVSSQADRIEVQEETIGVLRDVLSTIQSGSNLKGMETEVLIEAIRKSIAD